jgi:Zn-dependent protease
MIDLFVAQPLLFLIIFPGILLTIAFHEYAHCWTADKLGDPTPRVKGRLTLDPRVHLDPLGVIAILFTRFGWGKAAPYDPYNLKDPVRDSALIAASGALVNFLIAGILAAIVRVVPIGINLITVALVQLTAINVYLALFNLIPVKPLDGSKIMLAILPSGLATEYERIMDQFGIMILILLLVPFAGGVSPIVQLIGPLANFILSLLLG